MAGVELEDYRRKEREEKLKIAQPNPGNDGVVMEEDESSDDEVDSIPASSYKANASNKDLKVVKHDIIMKSTSSSVQETTLGLALGAQKQSFFKSTKSKYPMFPFHEKKIKWDDYGEIIKPPTS